MVSDKEVCERLCVKDGRRTADEEEEWEEKLGGTDLKTRTPHKNVWNENT